MIRSSSFLLGLIAAGSVFAADHAAAPAGGQPIVSDAVEGNDGWVVITQGVFASSKEAGELLPFEGSSFFDGRNTGDTQAPATNRGAAKYFSGVAIEPGTYTATFLVGKPAGLAFVNNLSVMLIADSNKYGAYTWAERLPATLVTSTRPAPADGDWATWSFVFKITPDTRTAGGFPASGATLGLMLLSNTKLNSGYAFDYLRITRTAPAR